MKKRAPNLTSFYTTKKRTRDLNPFYFKKKKKCLEIYLLTLDIYLLTLDLSRFLMNIYPNPSQNICINIYSVDPFFLCQEPDLNWWHEDFQSSALPTELSWPFLVHHLSKVFASMSIKGTKKSIKYSIQN